jgi:hypothetical protein
MKELALIVWILILSLIVIGGSCEPVAKPFDPAGNIRIADEAGKFLYGGPEFFYPPNVYWGSDPYEKNQTSAIAWCPTILVGNPLGPETINSYISRLNEAKVDDQTSWYEYQQIMGNPPSGYPGYLHYENGEIVYDPIQTYQTGFVCYALVYRTIIEAGYNPFNLLPLNCNELTNRLVGPIDPQVDPPKVGDIVAYDFDLDGIYEHVGIIENNSASVKKDWKIVSSFGVIEIFKFSACKTRLGVFGSINGGEFTTWEAQWENWEEKYFYVNTNN